MPRTMPKWRTALHGSLGLCTNCPHPSPTLPSPSFTLVFLSFLNTPTSFPFLESFLVWKIPTFPTTGFLLIFSDFILNFLSSEKSLWLLCLNKISFPFSLPVFLFLFFSFPPQQILGLLNDFLYLLFTVYLTAWLPDLVHYSVSNAWHRVVLYK